MNIYNDSIKPIKEHKIIIDFGWRNSSKETQKQGAEKLFEAIKAILWFILALVLVY